jgi:response regulator RpfG family c-di-GMP phosphodiesterase
MKHINFHILTENQKLRNKISTHTGEVWKNSKIINNNEFEKGIDSILKNSPSVVICDFHLRDGNGLHLLERIKKYSKDIDLYFIIIAENTDFDHIQALINFGCDDYLLPDSKNTMIFNRIRQAGRILNMKLKLKKENDELLVLTRKLEEEAKDLMSLSAKFMQARMPSSYEMLKRIADISVWIANQFPEFSSKEIDDIEIAAYFSQAGRMFLPDDLLKLPVMSSGIPQHDLMFQVPVAAANIARSVKSFSGVAGIIYHIYENFDGTGIPDKVQKWQIPLSSRIIRVVLDYEENRYFRNLKPGEILDKLKSRVNRLYDGRVVQLLEQYLHENDDDFLSEDMAVMIAELKEGMELTQDIESNSGIKLIGSGVVLSKKTIKMLVSHSTSDPVMGYIYVKKNINLKD